MNLLNHIIRTLSEDVVLLHLLLHANLHLIGLAAEVWPHEHDIGISWVLIAPSVSCSSIVLVLLLLLHLSEKLCTDLGLGLVSLELLLLILLVLNQGATGQLGCKLLLRGRVTNVFPSVEGTLGDQSRRLAASIAISHSLAPNERIRV